MDYASEKLVSALQELTKSESQNKNSLQDFSSFRLTKLKGSKGSEAISAFLKKKRDYEDRTKDIRVGTY
jgi:hypothetical protein